MFHTKYVSDNTPYTFHDIGFAEENSLSIRLTGLSKYKL